jgi:hypothetical protein
MVGKSKQTSKQYDYPCYMTPGEMPQDMQGNQHEKSGWGQAPTPMPDQIIEDSDAVGDHGGDTEAETHSSDRAVYVVGRVLLTVSTFAQVQSIYSDHGCFPTVMVHYLNGAVKPLSFGLVANTKTFQLQPVKQRL